MAEIETKIQQDKRYVYIYIQNIVLGRGGGSKVNFSFQAGYPSEDTN